MKLNFVLQVGNPKLDHMTWGRPEEMTMKRPVYKITKENPGSDLAGETAAALASASIVIRKTNRALATKAISHAKELFEFADTYRFVNNH